tara:strand:+ start:805 stop:2250 length:1446 start_codon:yes stop_codon:yes gene_type:complete
MNIKDIKSPILIIGSQSKIGTALIQDFEKENISYKCTSRDKNLVDKNNFFFDLADPNYDFLDNNFSAAIICAGTTNIQECEDDNGKLEKANVDNTIELIKKASLVSEHVLFLSSNAVFSGEEQFYEIHDNTCPATAYGSWKEAVEIYIKSNLKNVSILRLTKIITGKEKFIIEWKENADKQIPINTFKNKFISPLSIKSVVETIKLIVSRDSGIYHLGGSKEISYTEFANEFFKGDKKTLDLINPISYLEADKKYFNSLDTFLPTREAQYNTLLDQDRVMMGLMSGDAYLGDTKRLAFTLSRYKFVSKMFVGFDRVLEVGCADAFGSPLVMNEVNNFSACDFDEHFINDAKRTHAHKNNIDFFVHDMVSSPTSKKYEGLFCLDVLEHINPNEEGSFLRNICNSLDENGVSIIGIPSLESQVYASEISKEGHVNCKSGNELKSFLIEYFRKVFIFSMNDEVVHTGYSPMAQYLIALCCFPKK